MKDFTNFYFLIFIFYFRPAVTELQNVAQVERVRKEKSVCFFLVTSNENPQLSAKLKVNVDWKCILVYSDYDYDYLPVVIHKEQHAIIRELSEILNVHLRFGGPILKKGLVLGKFTSQRRACKVSDLIY